MYQKYFDELISLDPTINDALNLKKYKHLQNQFPNYLSSSYATKQKDLCNKYLDIINNKKKLNYYDKVLKYNLETELESFDTIGDLFPITHEENIIAGFCDEAAGNWVYQFKTHQDYYDFVERAKVFPDIVDSIICNMRKGIVKNIVLPKILTQKLIKQLKITYKNKVYHNPKAPKTLKLDYNKTIESILSPKIKQILEFLIKEYLPKTRETIGLCCLKGGKKYYKLLAQQHISLDKDSKYCNIPYIHKYGLREVERIHKEMMKTKEKYGFKGTINEFNQHLKSRKDLFFQSPEKVLNYYRKIQTYLNNTILKKYFNSDVTNISHKCVIKKVPKHNEEFQSGAYYLHPTIDGSRKGTFYINFSQKYSSYKMEVESLLLHEDSPGHHMNLTYLMESKLPLFIKMGDYKGFSEGWGMYSESLGEYKELWSYYGRLNMELMRAIRLVLDTGLHYYGWSFQKALNYYKKYSLYEIDEMKTHIYRYLAYPGQALCYKMGEKVILDLAEKYKGNIKDFHSKCLKYSNIPLKLLIEEFK